MCWLKTEILTPFFNLIIVENGGFHSHSCWEIPFVSGRRLGSTVLRWEGGGDPFFFSPITLRNGTSVWSLEQFNVLGRKMSSFFHYGVSKNAPGKLQM